MKIVYMGTPDFSVAPLKALIEAGHTVTAVVTQPDKQKGRGKEVSMTPVKECALSYGIPVLQPVKIKAPEAVEELRKYEADIFVVVAFGQLLSEEILNMPKFGCINLHASLLPKYRGAAPIQWAILNGDKETGVTIQQMEKGLDTGDMWSRVVVPIDAKETGESLHDKLMEAGAKLLVETLPIIEAGKITPEKQDESLAVFYAAKLDKAMGHIDWTKPAEVIERFVRGLNSWPSAYTFYKGKTLKIWDADVIEGKEGAIPGSVIRTGMEFFDIACGEGALRVLTVQLEGKKKMSVKDFLLGYDVREENFDVTG